MDETSGRRAATLGSSGAVGAARARRRVGVLFGGASGEREVSLRSGGAVATALEQRGHEVVRIDVAEPLSGLAGALSRAHLDAAFLALHGRLGEDGCVQGLLELLRIPYTGSGVLASALAMDKLKSKELFRLHNVPTPPHYALSSPEQIADLESVHGSFGYPVIVKPRGEGSSLGVSKAHGPHELARAVAKAFEHDDVVLVERFVCGMEVNVALLDGRVLGSVEIVPRKGLYDYEAKYTPGMTEYHVPARLTPARLRGVAHLAERAARAVAATGAVRVDLLVTPGENEYVLEVNTLPGMTETSLLPKIAAHAGLPFAELCEAILATARLHQAAPHKLQRHAAPRRGSIPGAPAQKEPLRRVSGG